MAKPGETEKEKVPGATAGSGTGTPKELAQKPKAELDIARPELEGLEGLGAEDIRVPQLRLLQGQAPDILNGVGAPGDFIDSITKRNYGKELVFIPLMFAGKARIQWKPKEEGGWNCISRDGVRGSLARVVTPDGPEYGNCATCRLKEFGTSKIKDKEHQPACTVIPSFFVAIPGVPFFAALSFPRTKMKVYQDFATMLRIQADEPGAPPIRHKRFKMGTVQQSGHGNTWLIPTIKSDGLVDDKLKVEIDKKYAELRESFSRLTIDLEDEEPVAAAPGQPGAAKF